MEIFLSKAQCICDNNLPKICLVIFLLLSPKPLIILFRAFELLSSKLLIKVEPGKVRCPDLRYPKIDVAAVDLHCCCKQFLQGIFSALRNTDNEDALLFSGNHLCFSHFVSVVLSNFSVRLVSVSVFSGWSCLPGGVRVKGSGKQWVSTPF